MIFGALPYIKFHRPPFEYDSKTMLNQIIEERFTMIKVINDTVAKLIMRC